jgi:hypothetical protein
MPAKRFLERKIMPTYDEFQFIIDAMIAITTNSHYDGSNIFSEPTQSIRKKIMESIDLCRKYQKGE